MSSFEKSFYEPLRELINSSESNTILEDFQVAANIIIDKNSVTSNDSFKVSSFNVSSSETESNINNDSDSELELTDAHRELFTRIFDKHQALESCLEKQNAIKLSLLNKCNELGEKLNILNKKNNKLNFELNNIYDEMYDIDCRVIENSSYSRRENLIITGIPESIQQNKLEENVLSILNNIGLRITSYEIAACHRLAKKHNRYPPPTIVRFTNRKAVDYCLKNRSILLEPGCKKNINMNIRFYENLCAENEFILKECQKLKNENLIHGFIIRNGFVKLIKTEGSNSIKIRNPDDLFAMLKNYYDNAVD